MKTDLDIANERIANLEAALVRVCKLAWTVAIDECRAAEQRAQDLSWTIKEMEKAGMDAWLPHFSELRGIFNMPEDTLKDLNDKRDKRLVEAVLASTATL